MKVYLVRSYSTTCIGIRSVHLRRETADKEVAEFKYDGGYVDELKVQEWEVVE